MYYFFPFIHHRERMGHGLMIETSKNPKCPKVGFKIYICYKNPILIFSLFRKITLCFLQVSAVSTIVNRGLPLKAYVFRNYNFLPGVRSHYLGGCQHKMWQAIRASSAAPGYFQEFVLGNDLHQVNHTKSGLHYLHYIHPCYKLTLMFYVIFVRLFIFERPF